MGSFDAICGITNSTIHYDDEVVKFYVIEQPRRGRSSNPGSMKCYSTNRFGFLSYPIFGKYNDCGDIIEDSESNWVTPHLIDAINSRIVEYKSDHDFDFDLALKPGHVTFNEFEDGLNRGNLYLKPRYKAPGMKNELGVGYMLIHRYVWDIMVNNTYKSWRNETVDLQKIKNDVVEYMSFTEEDMHQMIEDVKDKTKSMTEKERADALVDIYMEIKEKRSNISNGNNMVKVLTQPPEGDSANFSEYLELLDGKGFEAAGITEDKFIDATTQMIMFVYAFNTINVQLLPSKYGGQDGDSELHKMITFAHFKHLSRNNEN